MPAAVALRPDWDAKRVRAAAREARDADQARRLLAIAAAYEGQDRTGADGAVCRVVPSSLLSFEPTTSRIA